MERGFEQICFQSCWLCSGPIRQIDELIEDTLASSTLHSSSERYAQCQHVLVPRKSHCRSHLRAVVLEVTCLQCNAAATSSCAGSQLKFRKDYSTNESHPTIRASLRARLRNCRRYTQRLFRVRPHTSESRCKKRCAGEDRRCPD